VEALRKTHSRVTGASRSTAPLGTPSSSGHILLRRSSRRRRRRDCALVGDHPLERVPRDAGADRELAAALTQEARLARWM
jgi:hypothetical protein